MALEFLKDGYLQMLYCIAHSQRHLNKVLQWKNEQSREVPKAT